MKFKSLSLCADFVNSLNREARKRQRHAKIGDLLLTFKLLNTVHLSAESKLTYAYLFFHRVDAPGCKMRVLSDELGITPRQIRSTLEELERKNHIELTVTEQNADLSELTYYYNITEPTRYGMLDLEEEQSNEEEEMTLSAMAK